MKENDQRRAGRPPRLSRQQIVDAAVELLRADPGARLTMAAVAEAVDAVPMALYRYFNDRVELVDAVVRSFLGELEFNVEGSGSWEDQLGTWMRNLHDHFAPYPQFLQLLSEDAAITPAWLHSTATLVRILEHAGLEGVELARASVWVATSTMGYVVLSILMPADQRAAGLKASMDRLSPSDATLLEPLLPHIAAAHDEGFELCVRQTIAGVIDLGGRRSPTQSRARRAKPNP